MNIKKLIPVSFLVTLFLLIGLLFLFVKLEVEQPQPSPRPVLSRGEFMTTCTTHENTTEVYCNCIYVNLTNKYSDRQLIEMAGEIQKNGSSKKLDKIITKCIERYK